MAGMPWKECRAMGLKMEFVERAQKGEAIAALCREFNVSRQTGHKWLKRFKELGYEGLEEQSRRPKVTPLATAEELVIATLEAREAHPRSHSVGTRVVWGFPLRVFTSGCKSSTRCTCVLGSMTWTLDSSRPCPVSMTVASTSSVP